MISTFDQLVALVSAEAQRDVLFGEDRCEAIWRASEFISAGCAGSAGPFGFDLETIAMEARLRFPEATGSFARTGPNPVVDEPTWQNLDEMKAGTREPVFDTYVTTLAFFLRDLIVAQVDALMELRDASHPYRGQEPWNPYNLPLAIARDLGQN